MKIFTRIINYFRTRVVQMLDWAETPDDKFRNFLDEMNNRVQQLRDSVASAIVEEKRMHKELEQLHQKALTWEQRALTALKNGREDLAKEAIVERQKVERLGAELHQAWCRQERAVEELKSKFETVRAKTASARAEFRISMARYKAAEAQKSLSSGTNYEDNNSPVKLLEEINEKIVRIEAESEVNALLNGGERQSIEETFQAIELKQSVDEELLRMKLTLSGPESEQLALPEDKCD